MYVCTNVCMFVRMCVCMYMYVCMELSYFFTEITSIMTSVIESLTYPGSSHFPKRLLRHMRNAKG